jgi:hypothetical protein
MKNKMFKINKRKKGACKQYIHLYIPVGKYEKVTIERTFERMY